MTKDRYASVAVFRPIPSTFEYTIPEKLTKEIKEGSICLVPFQDEKVRGVVVDVSSEPSYKGSRKPIERVISPHSLQKSLIELAGWLSYTTLTPMGQVFNRMIPPDPTASPRAVKTIKLNNSFGEVHEYIEQNGKRAPKQAKLLQCLLSAEEPVEKKELLGRASSSRSPLDALLNKGFVQEVSIPAIERSEIGFSNLVKNQLPRPKPSVKREIDELPGSFAKYATYQAGDERLTTFMEVLRSITGEGMGLMLAPNVIRAEELTQLIRNDLDLVALSYHSDLTGGELSRRWNLAQMDEVDVFVGVLNAIYLPVSRLGGIVVEGEGHRNYELKDQDPKGNLVETALKRGELEDVPVILGGFNPSVRTYKGLTGGEFHQLGDPFPSGLHRSVNLTLGSTEGQPGDNLLSSDLQLALERNYDQGGSAIIIGEKTEASGAAFCKDCGEVVRCPDCQVPLSYTIAGNLGVCPYCGTKQDLLVCPNCGSDDIKFIGGGLEKAEREVNSLLPGAEVRRFDSKTESREVFSRIVSEVVEGNIDVLLGTSLVGSLYLSQGVSLVGLLDLDILLNRPTYRSTEFVWERVLSGYDLVEPRGELFIQGFQLDQPPFRLIQSGRWEELYQRELESRRLMGYPPCKELIEVQIRGGDEETAKKKLGELKAGLKTSNGGIEVLGSIDRFAEDKKDEFQSTLVVKAETLEGPLDEIHRVIRRYDEGRLRLNPFA